MLGGEYYHALLKEHRGKNDKIRQFAIHRLQTHIGTRTYLNITSHFFNKLLSCIPFYEPGHHLKIQNLNKNLTHLNLPLTISGNFIDGVSVNSCVQQSFEKMLAINV